MEFARLGYSYAGLARPFSYSLLLYFISCVRCLVEGVCSENVQVLYCPIKKRSFAPFTYSDIIIIMQNVGGQLSNFCFK